MNWLERTKTNLFEPVNSTAQAHQPATPSRRAQLQPSSGWEDHPEQARCESA
jgi:hypothetical protein